MAHVPDGAPGAAARARRDAKPCAAVRGDPRAGRRAHRDVLRQGLRHRLSRSAARGAARGAGAGRRPRRRTAGARRHGMARRRLLCPRLAPQHFPRDAEPYQRVADRGWLAGRGPGIKLAVAGANRRRAGELQPRDLPVGHRRGDIAYVPAGAALLPWARALLGSVGLRLPGAEPPHAGHGGRLRSADPPCVRAAIPDEAAFAHGGRPRAALLGPDRGSPLVPALPADRAASRVRVLQGRPAAARADQHLPAIQLSDADCAARVRALMAEMDSLPGIAFQILQSVFVVLAAPLLTGWINQCRAWLQNRSAPSMLLPYYTLARLFHKDAVMARDASPLFRLTPYVLFGCMWLAAGIVPVLATNLPFAPAADIIALVGLFATARVFSALAAMDTGTSFGGLGARREMMIGFLAEPAMLMTLFTAAFISNSTALTTIVETLAHREFAIHPSLAFAAVAFLMVLLAENARIPVDNPATHLELTMIHEAMILEYSARHLALIEWASAIKLATYCAIGIACFLPWGIAEAGDWGALPVAILAAVAKLLIAGAGLAVLETVLAKMRLLLAPEFLSTAFLLAVLGMLTHFLVRG